MSSGMYAVRVKYKNNTIKYWLGESYPDNVFVVVSIERLKLFLTREEAKQAIQIYQANTADSHIECFEIVFINIIDHLLVCDIIGNM